MNQRIEKLAEQCRIETYGANGELLTFGFDEEKFAELIVRECAKFSYSYTYNDKNFEEWKEYGWDCMPGDLRNAIMEHFGVEE